MYLLVPEDSEHRATQQVSRAVGLRGEKLEAAGTFKHFCPKNRANACVYVLRHHYERNDRN
jgi:hypothetical protein